MSADSNGGCVPQTARMNPHPSCDPDYDVEIVGEPLEGVVEVRYIKHPEISWIVNEDVPAQWVVDEWRS